MHNAIFLLNVTLWGFSFVAIRYVVEHVPPIFGAWTRVAIATFALLIIARLRGNTKKLQPELRGKVWIAGIFLQGAPFALLYWGEQVVSAGLAAIINGTMPLWIFVCGLLFMRQLESFSWTKLVGLLLGFSGICLIFVPMLHQPELGTDFWWGFAAVVGMVLCYTVGTLLNRHFFAQVKDLDLFACTIHQHYSSLALLTLVVWLLEGGFPVATLVESPVALWSSVYLGVGSTALAWLCYLTLIRAWGAVRAGAVTYGVPLIAIITDWIFFQTIQPLTTILGACTVFASLLVIHRSK